MNEAVKTDIHPLLDAFVKVAPFLNQLIQDDVTVGIYDTEKLIVNIPGKTFSLMLKRVILCRKAILLQTLSAKTKRK